MTKSCSNCQWSSRLNGAFYCTEARRLRLASSVGLGGDHVLALMPVAVAPNGVCDFHSKPKDANYREAADGQ